MKKFLKYSIWIIITFLIFSNTVYADQLNPCESAGVLRIFKLGGLFLYIVKIVVPIILIIGASIDLFNAVIGDAQKVVTASIKKEIIRIIGGVVIFLVPTIATFILDLSGEFTNIKKDYKTCYDCLFSPTECKPEDAPNK